MIVYKLTLRGDIRTGDGTILPRHNKSSKPFTE
jgi:hypothetical protein